MGEIKNQNSGPSSEEGTDPPKSKRLYQVWKGRNQLKVREAEKLKGNVFRPPNTPTRCSTADNIVKNANLLLLSMTKVQLNFTIKGFLYNTTQAYYKCSLSHRLCSLKLFLLRANAAVLTSPATEQGVPYKEWLVKVSYGPRWITYVLGSGIMTVIVLLAFRICNMLQITREDEIGFRVGEVGPERAPLLSHKDDDLLSRGSSYDSISHDEEEVDEWLIVPSIDGKASKEGESNSSPRRLCVICFDAPRDCFFLPCGHCATCFACGTRVVEEAGTCPICRRTMKKVRKIFTV